MALLLVTSVITPFLGLSPVVQPARAGSLVTAESFEEQPADDGFPENWEAKKDGSSIQTINVTTDRAYAGSQAVYLSDGGAAGTPEVGPQYQPYDTARTGNASMALYSPGGSTANFLVDESGVSGNSINIRVNSTGYLQYSDGAAWQTVSNGHSDEWVEFEVYNIDVAADTFAIRYENATNTGTATGLSMSNAMTDGWHNSQIAVAGGAYFDELKLPPSESKRLEGQVVNQQGAPVANATVMTYAVNTSQVSSTTEAKERLKNASNPRPAEWSPDLSLKGSTGVFNTDKQYVAVTRKELNDAGFLLDTADLSNPQLTVPADEPFVVTRWDGGATGGLADSFLSGEYARQLPGEPQSSGTVTIEQLAASGETVQTSTVSLNKTVGGGVLDPSQLTYGEVEGLPPGYYRVSPSDGGLSYVIQVGDPAAAIDASLKAAGGGLTGQSKWTQDQLNNNTFIKRTTVTGSNGRFAFNLPKNVEAVGVQAMKAEGLSTQRYAISPEEIRKNESSLTGAVYLPSEVERTTLPATDVKLTMRELSYPQHGNISKYQDRLRDLLNSIRNGSFSKLPPALQQQLENMSRASIEETFTELDKLRKANKNLEEQYRDALKNANGGTNVDVNIDPSQATDQELRQRVQALQQSMTELQSTIESGDPSVSTGKETVSLSFPFDTNLDPSNVAVRVHFNNGTSTVLSTDSQYVSIDSRSLRGDVVRITDYPLGQGDGEVANFEVDIATSEGTGGASETVTNPTFSGSIPSLSAVEFSTLKPGPSEEVSVEIHPEDSAKYQSLVSTTVYGPQGSQLPTSNITNDEFTFTTAGAGVHRVELTFTNSGGIEFTEVVHVQTGQTSEDWPASIRTKSGPTGVYALVGDGLDSGRVNVKEGGSKIDVAAIIPQSADAPSSLHVYTQGLETASASTTQVSVLRGDREEAVKKHVPVTVHGPAIGENALVYRDGEPLPRGEGNQYGRVEAEGNQTVIETITTDEGTVSIRVSADPGFVERARYWVDTRVPDVALPGLSIFPSLPGAPSPTPAFGGLALLGAAATLRRRYP